MARAQTRKFRVQLKFDHEQKGCGDWIEYTIEGVTPSQVLTEAVRREAHERRLDMFVTWSRLRHCRVQRRGRR